MRRSRPLERVGAPGTPLSSSLRTTLSQRFAKRSISASKSFFYRSISSDQNFSTGNLVASRHRRLHAYFAWLRGVGGSSHYHPVLAVLDEIIVVWHDHDAVLLDSITIIVRMRGFADCMDDFYVMLSIRTKPVCAREPAICLKNASYPHGSPAIEPVFGVQALYLANCGTAALWNVTDGYASDPK